jgi:hypothetical protein
MVDTTTTNYALVKPEIGASNNTWGTKINANLDALDGMVNTIRATYGGTADAITLTATGAALTTGLRVSFTPTAANTAATTINLNGGGAVTVQPLARSGVALPSGYIRADVPVTAIYNGTVWLIERQTEYGTNANGDFTRFADGTLICRHDPSTIGGLSVAIGAQYVSSSYPFPAAFSGTSHSLHYSGFPTTGGGSRLNQVGLQRDSGVADWRFNFQNNSAATVTQINNPNLTAIGKWF